MWIAFRYGRRNRPATQEVQQRIAELTAEAEENVAACGWSRRSRRRSASSRASTCRVGACSTSRWSPRACAPSTARFIGFLPQLGLAALLFVGGRQAIDGSITVGEFVAFYGYVLMLTGPMRMLGIALGMAQRAVASGTRVFELLDREPQLTAAAGRSAAARAAAGAWSCAT